MGWFRRERAVGPNEARWRIVKAIARNPNLGKNAVPEELVQGAAELRVLP